MAQKCKLIDLINKYGLPLDVKKDWWFGDYYFCAEQITNYGTVKGTVFKNGYASEKKSFSESEMMVLCEEPDDEEEIDEDLDEEVYEEDDEEELEIQFVEPQKGKNNPNGLDTNKNHYIAGVTKLFVNNKKLS